MSDFKLLAIDPGRDKTGIAIVDSNKDIVDHRIINSSELNSVIDEYCKLVDRIVLGNGTFSKDFLKSIKKCSPDTEVFLVDEKNSTIEAGKPYFKLNPPKGIKRFLPSGLLFPPVPVDDYAAVVIAYRYIDSITT